MTAARPRHDLRVPSPALVAERQRLWREAGGESVPWAGGSSLFSGVLLLGGLGWLAQHLTGWLWPLPVGIVLGMAAALTSLWFRYGVDRSPEGTSQVNGSAAVPRASCASATQGCTGGGTTPDDAPTTRSTTTSPTTHPASCPTTTSPTPVPMEDAP